MNQSFDDVRRIKHKYEFLCVIGVMMMVTGFLLFIPMGLRGIEGQFFVMGLVVIGSVTLGFAKKHFKKATKGFKEKQLRSMVNDMLPGGTFYADGGFTEDETLRTRIMKRSDRFFSEDMIDATHQGIRLRSADVKLQEVRHSGKSTTVVTTFLGRLHALDFEGDFPTDMIICQPSFFGRFRYNDYSKIDTESMDFNDDLDVYAADGLGAFKVLKPDFMEKLAAFDAHYGDKIAFSFQKNRCYVAINTKEDTFDIRLFRPFDEGCLEEYKNQLSELKTMMAILATAARS